MQIVTVNLPNMFVDAIARLVHDHRYPSRSEAIRVALRDFLQRELAMVEMLLEMSDAEQVTKEKEGQVPEEKPAAIKKLDMRTIRTGW